jgi:hypothetical protein
MSDRADQLQSLCLAGQEQLMAMQYLQAEATLVQAEAIALETQDWDTLSRLYMPLQECRRQRRLRCGEGVVKLDLIPDTAGENPDAAAVAREHSHGQFLVAGFGSIEPARQFRAIARSQQLYAETFLAAVYPIAGGGRAVAIVPSAEVALPPAEEMPVDRLIQRLPPHSIVLPATELPTGAQAGTAETFAYAISFWERLHLPFLALADATTDLRQRIAAYRRTIEIDYACELAHQNLSNAARELARQNARAG